MMTSARSYRSRNPMLASAVRLVIGFEKEGLGKAVQASRDETDINTIVKRFGLTGQLPQNIRTPLEGDFTNAIDFRTAMDAIVAADRSFSAMPADVRKRFGNDPADFVDFTTARDSTGKLVNLDEMRKLGLAVPEEIVTIPPPMRVEVVNPATPPA